MIRREQRRLDRAFSAVLLALAPAALAQACERSPIATPVADVDASDIEATAPDDAADAANASMDAAHDTAACNGTVRLHDAGPLDADADADRGCDYAFPCGLPPGLALVGCEVYIPYPDGAPAGPLGCRVAEGDGCFADAFSPGEGGALSFTCIDCVGGSGRRPRGLRKLAPRPSPSARGAYLARMAYEESASVHAFVAMREELAFHGAPEVLVRGAERAARDEIRHAARMAGHARDERAPVSKARTRRRSVPRTLAMIARENAVEGCVRETFGALLLRWQATHAEDAALRRTFAQLAEDEARHAALSWAVARWLDTRLDVRARERIARAQRNAVRSLDRRVRATASFDASLGQPHAAVASALLDALTAALGLRS